MSYTNGLDKPSDYFATKLYVGNATDNTGITGVGFQPDWVWLKDRTNGNHHRIYDSVRGATKVIYSSLNSAEGTASTGLKSFDSDGFTLGTGSDENGNGANFVSWNWLGANGTASNSNGSITSTVSANTTAGFSIVSYTGNGTAGATVGHGLGVTPKMIIVKKRSGVSTWNVYHEAIGNTKGLYLNTTDATTTYTGFWNDTSPTSSVFTVGADNTTNSATYIAYCFAEKQGYSKFGSYTGNGNADGAFIYTGFKTAFVMIKKTDSAGNYWHIYDNKRSSSGGSNVINDVLYPNRSDAEYSEDRIDFVSNGFKIRTTNGDINTSGGNYIFMAFAENPFVTSTGIPTTAR